MKREFSRQIFENYSDIIFLENPFRGNRISWRRADGQTDRQTWHYMTNLVVTFRNFGMHLKSVWKKYVSWNGSAIFFPAFPRVCAWNFVLWKILYVYTSFYDVCVLLIANVLKQYWPFFCQVLLNLLFIRWSSYLCIGVVCLFMLYALRHINMGTWCIVNSLETLSDVLFVLVQLCIWYVHVVVSNTRQLAKFVMTFLGPE